MFDLAIVGGAAASIHLLAELADRSKDGTSANDLKIAVIDPHINPEGGSPHSDTSRAFRVNMRTELHDIKGVEPFVEFLHRDGGLEEEPPLRADLGRYLREAKSQSVRVLAAAGTDVRFIRDSCIALNPYSQPATRFQLALTGHRPLDAARVVLAIGNPPPTKPANVQEVDTNSRRISYYNGDSSFAGCIEPRDRILVLGTGPGAVDVARHLIGERGHVGKIHLVSHRGLLSAVQLADASSGELDQLMSASLADLMRRQGSLNPAKVMRHFLPVFRSVDPTFSWRMLAISPSDARAELVANLAQAGGNEPRWRLALDAFGKLAPAMWRGFSSWAKADFTGSRLERHYYAHRHGMPASTASWLADQLATGQIAIGRIQDSGVEVSRRAVQTDVTLLPGAVGRASYERIVVATGPQYRLSLADNPLIRQLLDSGLAQPCREKGRELGGFCTSGLELSGLPGVFAMGALVRGEDYAVHSFPALRRHAETIANRLFLRLR